VLAYSPPVELLRLLGGSDGRSGGLEGKPGGLGDDDAAVVAVERALLTSFPASLPSSTSFPFSQAPLPSPSPDLGELPLLARFAYCARHMRIRGRFIHDSRHLLDGKALDTLSAAQRAGVADMLGGGEEGGDGEGTVDGGVGEHDSEGGTAQVRRFVRFRDERALTDACAALLRRGGIFIDAEALLADRDGGVIGGSGAGEAGKDEGTEALLPVPSYTMKNKCEFELRRFKLACRGRALQRRTACPLGCLEQVRGIDMRFHVKFGNI
jgi:hypothetical protein